MAETETNWEMWQRLGLMGNKWGQRDYPGELLHDIKALGWPEPVREHKFHGWREWRLDLAWPDIKLAVECHGGIHTRGRHTRGTGFTKDREKMNAAIELGWQVLEIACPMQLKEAIGLIESCLRQKGAL